MAMWTLTITPTDETEPVVITQADMRAGEEEIAWACATGMVAHEEWTGTNPRHCPGCLNGIAVAALACRAPADGLTAQVRIATAALQVTQMTRAELLSCVDFVDVPTEPVIE